MKKRQTSSIEISYSDTSSSNGIFQGKCCSGYDLVYILSGNGKWVLDGGETSFECGNIYLFKPLVYHRADSGDAVEYREYTFSFAAKDLSDDLRQRLDALFLEYNEQNEYGESYSEISDFAVIKPHDIDEVERLFGGVGFASKLSGESQHNYLSAVIAQAILWLSASESKPQRVSGDYMAERIVDYINHNLEKGKILALDDLQAYFLVSKFYLCRVFKKERGISIHAFINQKRIMIAKQFIDEGMNAREVAKMVGYNEYSAFYRAYVKVVGTSPKFTKGETNVIRNTR